MGKIFTNPIRLQDSLWQNPKNRSPYVKSNDFLMAVPKE